MGYVIFAQMLFRVTGDWRNQKKECFLYSEIILKSQLWQGKQVSSLFLMREAIIIFLDETEVLVSSSI